MMFAASHASRHWDRSAETGARRTRREPQAHQSPAFVSAVSPGCGIRSGISSGACTSPLYSHRVPSRKHAPRRAEIVCLSSATESEPPAEAESWDVVVIGSGFGGLSCAAIATALGFKTLVLESHYAAGGVAHGFDHKTKAGNFHLDTGPSFFCALTTEGSLNPVKQVLDAVDEKVECRPYDRFCIDDLKVGTVEIHDDDEKTMRSIEALAPGSTPSLRKFYKVMRNMHANMNVPAIALRGDALVIPVIMSRWATSLLGLLPFVGDIQKPVQRMLDRCGVRNPFLQRICDLEAFLLSGLKASGTITAEIAFMVGERGKLNAMEYPIGGARAVIDAMVRGIEKNASEVRLRSHVERIIVKNGEAVGVEVRGRGRQENYVVNAKRAVVSNASIWDTFGSLVDHVHLSPSFVRQAQETPTVESFMHAHMAIPAKDLPAFVGHHAVVIDSDIDIAEPGNTVMISVPTSWSPEIAPEGWHIVHAYTLESYDRWPELAKDRDAYEAAKESAAQPLFQAIRSVFPDLDERLAHPDAFVKLGSPLTHARFNRRHKGTYGPAIVAGEAEFPWPQTPIKNLFRVGDSVFPGIGVPAAAASGIVAATSLVGAKRHLELVDKVYPRS